MWSVLTTMLILVHAGTAAAPAVTVGAIWGHWGQKGVTGAKGRLAVVPHKVLHFGGLAVGAQVSDVSRALVEADSAIVEVQCRGRRHVRPWGLLVEVWGTVTKDGLLFDGSCHQLWGAEGGGCHHNKTMSPRLHLQLLWEFIIETQPLTKGDNAMWSELGDLNVCFIFPQELCMLLVLSVVTYLYA